MAGAYDHEWHYLTHGRTTHARKRRSNGLDAVAACGAEPGWRGWWLGTGAQSEYERAAALPKCRRCVELTEGKRI